VVFSNFFRKKTTEEFFQEAVKERNYLKVVSYGRELLEKGNIPTSIINHYVDALIKLGNKKEAVELLVDYAENKLKNGYYSSSIAFLKKVLAYDASNFKAVKLLSNAYMKKKLHFEAFNVLISFFNRLQKEGKDISKIREQIEYFLDKYSHPVFYEVYAEILDKAGFSEEVYKNLMVAGGMFVSVKKYDEALDCYLRARKIKQNDIIDGKIIETVTRIGDSVRRKKILKGLILNNISDIDFLHNAVKEFVVNNLTDDIDQVILSLKDSKLKWVILSLRDIEVGEIEQAFGNIENLYKIDVSIAEKIKGKLFSICPEAADYDIEKSSPSDIPSSNDILASIFSVVEDELSDEDLLNVPEKSEVSISRDEIGEVGDKFDSFLHKISMAEAMLGLGNYDKAISLARECLEYPEVRFRALSLIASAYSVIGDSNEALKILIDALKEYSFSPDEEKALKETIAKVYEEMGDSPKASFWYKEANSISS